MSTSGPDVAVIGLGAIASAMERANLGALDEQVIQIGAGRSAAEQVADGLGCRISDGSMRSGERITR